MNKISETVKISISTEINSESLPHFAELLKNWCGEVTNDDIAPVNEKSTDDADLIASLSHANESLIATQMKTDQFLELVKTLTNITSIPARTKLDLYSILFDSFYSKTETDRLFHITAQIPAVIKSFVHYTTIKQRTDPAIKHLLNYITEYNRIVNNPT